MMQVFQRNSLPVFHFNLRLKEFGHVEENHVHYYLIKFFAQVSLLTLYYSDAGN